VRVLRIAVFSDTHGYFGNLQEACRTLGSVDRLIHAGDHFTDMAVIARQLSVPPDCCHGVSGNMDYPPTGPAEERLTLGGVRILVIHGHRHGVKTGPQRLLYRAQELNAQAVVFGHSHVAYLEEVDGVLLFNPGSLSEPRLPSRQPSCGLIEIVDGTIRARHIFVGGQMGGKSF
jgi:uncharacterized protein